MTPANWIPNQPVIIPAPQTVKEMEDRIQSIQENRNGLSWYLSFKNIPEKCENAIDTKEE